jgi:hypothetical protein
LPVNSDNKAKADLKIKIKFKFNADAAQSVTVAGTFNDWDAKQLPLKKNGGAWTAELALPRGRYEYRFVVDGNWVADPNAGESVPNPYGNCNSLLNVWMPSADATNNFPAQKKLGFGFTSGWGLPASSHCVNRFALVGLAAGWVPYFHGSPFRIECGLGLNKKRGNFMYHHIKKLMYTVRVGSPDPRFGNMLLEQFGGANGELAAAMQYSIQGLNCTDPARKDLLMDIGTEELSHLEIVGTLARMHLKPMKTSRAAGEADPLVAIAGGGGVSLCNSMGNPWI